MLQQHLCADDFGLNPGVNEGVLQLCALGRLSAVSCMTVGAAFEDGASRMRDSLSQFPSPPDLGLHLTLTEFAPLGAMPHTAPDNILPQIGALLKSGVTGRLARDATQAEIRGEILRQVDRFVAAFGHLPAFVDGHQHAHIVPGVPALLRETEDKWRGPKTWVRACGCPWHEVPQLPDAQSKALLLAGLSALCHAIATWPRNRWFYGVNGFDTSQDFGTLMRHWLRLAARHNQPSLIMVHPGQPWPDPKDVIAERRPQELSYLMSDQYLSDAVHNVLHRRKTP